MAISKIILLLTIPVCFCWIFAYLSTWFIFFPVKKKTFLGISTQGLLLTKMQTCFTDIVDNLIKNESVGAIFLQKISFDDVIQQLQPNIELHVDDFLNNKLKESFPLLFQMLGDKTMLRIREIFLAEVQLILPEILKTAKNNFGKSLTVPSMRVDDKLFESINEKVCFIFSKHIFRFRMAAVFIGILIGCLEIMLFKFL